MRCLRRHAVTRLHRRAVLLLLLLAMLRALCPTVLRVQRQLMRVRMLRAGMVRVWDVVGGHAAAVHHGHVCLRLKRPACVVVHAMAATRVRSMMRAIHAPKVVKGDGRPRVVVVGVDLSAVLVCDAWGLDVGACVDVAPAIAKVQLGHAELPVSLDVLLSQLCT